VLHVSGPGGSDLVTAVSLSRVTLRQHAPPEAALSAAVPGDAVALLAGEDPNQPQGLSPAIWSRLADAGVRAYVEYPASTPPMPSGEPVRTAWERLVVSSDFFGPTLPSGRILVAHGCTYLPMEATSPHLVAARVAGYDEAVYGLPEAVAPLLFQHGELPALIAASGLSYFIRGRFAPAEDWATVWRAILTWLMPAEAIPPLSWEATVRPSFTEREPLPRDAERQAFGRGCDWYYRSRVLIHPTWSNYLAPKFARGVESGPSVPGYLVNGDGRSGILEGFSAEIDHEGRQNQRYVIRTDCISESAMALALHGEVTGNETSRDVAEGLIDYALFDSLIHQGVRADPYHPTYGLLAWGVTSWAWERAFYGDDNARSLLGMIAVSAVLREPRWGESICRALLANLRTTGALGFRGSRIDIPDFEANGWRHFHDREIVNPSPHYEAYLWACFLWAYRATGYEEFLRKPLAAIETTMAAYPEGWALTNGITLDRARMLLPLAWLVRVDDTPRHREWLMAVARDLLESQVECGAIREEIGGPGQERSAAVESNEAYGTNETSLVQRNGDPATDLLYTTNFAFLGLREASRATGDPELHAAEDRMAAFLTRAQIRSSAHPELDGGWFRGFDYRRWDYWSSSADVGWGAWCLETGWSQGWIASVLGLRALGTSFWELTADLELGQHVPSCLTQMSLGDGGPYRPRPRRRPHLAEGCPYDLKGEPDDRYPDVNRASLTDGQEWPPNAPERWVGWWGTPMVVTVDLGEVRALSRAGAVFLVSGDIGVLPPVRLRVQGGREPEARDWSAEVRPPAAEPGDRWVHAIEVTCAAPAPARFLTIQADPVPELPAWHRSAGLAAWLMCCELAVF